MVALGPGRFYGSSLPRPRIYTDVKYSSDRVDPPSPVLDPLMLWAQDAHWSMGGLSFQRLRLQGRIEGNVDKLRTQIEKSIKEKESRSPELSKKKFVPKSVRWSGKKKREGAGLSRTRSRSLSPPPAPVANKRRRFVGLVDEEDAEREAVSEFLVRNLSDEFDRVANVKKSPARSSRGGSAVASRTRSSKTENGKPTVKIVSKCKRRLRKTGDGELRGSSPSTVTRNSPRLASRG